MPPGREAVGTPDLRCRVSPLSARQLFFCTLLIAPHLHTTRPHEDPRTRFRGRRRLPAVELQLPQLCRLACWHRASHTARRLPGLRFPNVREATLREIWYDSPGFNAFRGTGWMPEPSRSCPEKDTDLGGCRCQAYLLTQDASATDPVCENSPSHDRIERILAQGAAPGPVARPLVFRDPQASLTLTKTPAG